MKLDLEVLASTSIQRRKPWPRIIWIGEVRMIFFFFFYIYIFFFRISCKMYFGFVYFLTLLHANWE